MAQCSKCGRATKGDYTVCFSCKTDQSFAKHGTRYCPDCGTKIAGNFKYCFNCSKHHK